MICIKRGGIMKKPNKFKYKQVKIIWIDIISSSEWMSLEKATNKVYSFCEDIGYLLYKDSKKLSIFTSYSFDDDGNLEVGGVTTYPRKVVLKIERMK